MLCDKLKEPSVFHSLDLDFTLPQKSEDEKWGLFHDNETSFLAKGALNAILHMKVSVLIIRGDNHPVGTACV